MKKQILVVRGWSNCSRFLTFFLFAALLSAVPAAGQGFDPTKTPVTKVPQARWGDLEPGGIMGDLSWWNFGSTPGPDHTFWHGVDVENGYIFTTTGRGIKIYNANANQSQPPQEYSFYASTRSFSERGMVWHQNDTKFYLFGVDAPAGYDGVAAVAAISGNGLLIWDTRNKSGAALMYQDDAKDGSQVWSATLGGKHYAFYGGTSSKVLVYNMSAALGLSSACRDLSPTSVPCQDGQGNKVYVGKIPTQTGVTYLHGAGNYLAVSQGFLGVEVWLVANPASPQQLLKFAPPGGTYGVAMWQEGNTYYLATVNTDANLRIYDVSCVTGGSCGGNPPLVSTTPVPAPSLMLFATVSRRGSVPYVYVGGEDQFSGTPQREYLFDVSDPGDPLDITPSTNVAGYWGWYYYGNATGFNWVMPRQAKFYGDYLYRAAFSLMDVHHYTGAAPGVADFTWTPAAVYPGDPISFSDASTGHVTSWGWSFAPDGSPTSSALENPTGVSFPTAGSKSVTLIVNGGESSKTLPLTVLPPQPVVGSVSVSPPNPTVCQPVTFTAQGVGGKAPLSFAWNVSNTGGTVNTGTTNPHTWNTALGIVSGGEYTAQVTVSNGFSPNATASAIFTLASLTALPAAGSFSPTNEPFTAGTVQLHVSVPGATEWSWDYGDGLGFRAWTNDPIAGPNPVANYTTTGVKPVKVRIRNCIEGERESAVLNVNITQVVPLTASFEAQCSFGFCGFSVGELIQFVDASTGAEIWDYDWNGDGVFEDANHAAPVTSHAYSATSPAGGYFPKLRVRRGASEAVTFTHQAGLTVGAAQPPSILVTGPTSGSVGQNYSFSASASNCTPSASGWSWTTSGGSGSSTSNTISLSWSTSGSKNVRASNSACGSAQGTRTINIGGTGGGGGAGGGGGGGGGSLVADFTYGPVPVFAGAAVSFNGAASTGSPTNWAWTFGDGSPPVFGQTATHAFAAAGTYSVVLEVSKSGNCPLGICTASKTVSVSVIVNGPPPPVAAFTVTSGATCIDEFGLSTCGGDTGVDITFSSSSTGTVDSLSWDFGDGQTASGATAVHRYLAPGHYVVVLTASGDGKSSTKSTSFNIKGEAINNVALVLTWFQRSHGALEQTSDFYVYNPGAESLQLSVSYLKRGKPSPTPPQKDLVIAPQATLFVADALKALFNLDEGSGFLYFVWEGSVEPVITGTNNTKLADGTTFGQSFAAVKVARSSSAAAESTPIADQSLVGLADIAGESFSTFGVSNPFDAPANIELQFTDGAGAPLRPGLPVTIARNGQVLYQIEDIRALGMEDQDNYRVTVKSVSGGPVIPFAKKLRAGSQDQAFVPAIKTYQPKVLLLGTYSGDTVRGNRWSTDAVLFNPTTAELVVEARFIPVGVDSEPSAVSTFHLQPKESRRLVDILETEWNAQGVNGYIQFETTNGGSGPYAGVLGEIYDYSNPGKIYGNVFGALSADDAAGPDESLALVGLSQNSSFTTTLWLYNPGPGPAQAEIVYRASSDGRELARTLTGSPEGTMRLINPIAFPAAVQNTTETFTIEMHVNFGNMVASALMVSSATKDPTYVVGVAH